MVRAANAERQAPTAAIPARLRDRARELSLIANAASVDAAHKVARLVALGWWDARIRQLGADPARLKPAHWPTGAQDLPRIAVVEAADFGRTLATMAVSEAHAVLGQLYSHALPAEHRGKYGVHYTPRPLMLRLLDQAEHAGHGWPGMRAIDPSCGHGAFLVEAASRMLRQLDAADPAIALTSIASRLRGWDIDPFAVWLAQLSVELLALPTVVRSGRRLQPVTELRDALTEFQDTAGTWDLVMGNPPFGKVKDHPQIRATFHRSLFGHPNLYGLFTDLGLHLAKPDGGLVAYLTPASFLGGDYFRKLRGLLHEHAPPVTLDLVESRSDVFEDVLQEVALSTFQRGRARQLAECSVLRATPKGIAIEPAGTFALPSEAEAPWILPRRANDVGLVERLREMPTRLSDWGYAVSTGPLVWNRHKTRLYDEQAPGRVPVVWAEAVTPDGRFVLRASKRNHRGWYEPRSSGDANLVERPCVLVQRTTAKEQRRRLIAAEMPASLLARCAQVAVEKPSEHDSADQTEARSTVALAGEVSDERDR